MTQWTVFLFSTLVATFFLKVLNEKNKDILMLAATGDEDIKIATDNPSADLHNWKQNENSEQTAEQFLKQKESGNIDLARNLGKLFADELFLENGPVYSLLPQVNGNNILNQRIMLYSYAVNIAIQDNLPNSIVIQTSLNVFYEEVEQRSDTLFKMISDMGAFSLYILNHRVGNGGESGIGGIFARLCGQEENEEMIRQGQRLYEEFYSFCRDRISTVHFSDI